MGDIGDAFSNRLLCEVKKDGDQIMVTDTWWGMGDGGWYLKWSVQFKALTAFLEDKIRKFSFVKRL